MMSTLLLFLLACDEPAPIEEVQAPATEGPINIGPIDALLAQGEPVAVPVEKLDDYTEALWQKWRQEQSADSGRLAEHEARSITQAGKTMRYTMEIRGKKPSRGYPVYIALHGGGGAPAAVNDEQWAAMQSYYSDSIESGIYVVPRGITDEWNLHFDDAAYTMYDRLIENLLVMEEVDPDRVYLLGFSAGGDGVYQIAPRMADRFAAVSMSAGHHNDVPPDNLYRLPILLQMGELDDAYDRSRSVVAFSGKLDALRTAHPEGYLHALFLHHDGGHNAPWSDHDPTGEPYPIIHKPQAWLADGDRSTAQQNTNAIHWLSRHIRTAWPDRVIWDRSTTAPERPGVWYWVEAQTGERIDVQISRRDNAITVHEVGDRLRILLNHRMLDLSRPVVVSIGEQRLTVEPEPDLRDMAETLAARGDPAMIFPVILELEQVDGAWSVR